LLWIPSSLATSKAKSLQLVGAIVSARGGVALVKNRDTSEVKAFKTGEDVFNIGTLLSVDRQQMILVENDGHMTMVSNKLGGMTGRQAPKVLISSADKHIEDGFQRIGTKIEVDGRYRDRLIRDELPNILMQASSEPVVVNGEITGFRIFQFDQNSIFHKLGLQDGDVIREINGIPLNNVARTIQFLNGLREENHVQVNVLRNGSPVTLDLNVR
ncbi:PDZ domain-containing protein, partial [bacterium]|nr:PDZ domain-containing protein [bacterium]